MSQLQARRADFAEWCKARGHFTDEEKTKYWMVFSAGWEAAADRVVGCFERALGSEPPPSEDSAS